MPADRDAGLVFEPVRASDAGRAALRENLLETWGDPPIRSTQAAMNSRERKEALMAATTLPGGTFDLAEDLTVTRMGYGAMQLGGPHVFGPPADRNSALAVLREAVELGITHIDTSDFYGPHVTNQIIKQALHPYPEDLRIVTKVGSRRCAMDEVPGISDDRTELDSIAA